MIKMKKYTHYICKSYSTLPVDPIEYFVQINILGTSQNCCIKFKFFKYEEFLILYNF